jgi:hypothetical protein
MLLSTLTTVITFLTCMQEKTLHILHEVRIVSLNRP